MSVSCIWPESPKHLQPARKARCLAGNASAAPRRFLPAMPPKEQQSFGPTLQEQVTMEDETEEDEQEMLQHHTIFAPSPPLFFYRRTLHHRVACFYGVPPRFWFLRTFMSAWKAFHGEAVEARVRRRHQQQKGNKIHECRPKAPPPLPKARPAKAPPPLLRPFRGGNEGQGRWV